MNYTKCISAIIVAGLLYGQAGAETPPNFPRVSKAHQESRDFERKRILEDELKAEQARLADAIAKNDSVAMARHTADIQSLSKELGVAVRSVPAAATVKTDDANVNAFGSEEPQAFGTSN